MVFNLASVPLIESSIRKIVKICGGEIYKENKVDGINYTTLHALLDDSFPQKILGDAWNKLSFYFSVVLTHQIGWNIRNDFCHGVNKGLFFESYVGDRLSYPTLFEFN